MKTLKWILSTAIALTLTACAFDKNSNTDREKEIENRQKLVEQYAPVVGVYQGTFTTSTTTQNIELRFYIVDIPDGRNSDNQPKYRTALMARFDRENVVDPVFMETSYLPQSGELFMSNENASLAARGRLIDNVITGTVTKNGGVLGQVKVQLVSRESSAPSENDQAERNERARRIYEAIAGVYAGVIKLPPQVGPSFGAVVEIFVAQRRDSNNNLVPYLSGYFRRDDDRSRERELILDIEYRSDVYPPEIDITTSPTKNPNGIYTISIGGTIENGVIKGTFVDHRGKTAEVALKKR